MRVLVTGGAGFIGSHTVEALLEAGAWVRVFDNLSTGKRGNVPDHPKVELQEGDIRNPQEVNAVMQGVSHVLHLAAQVSVQASVEDPPTSCTQNIYGFVNVMHAACQNKVQRFVYASSAAVYGVPEQVPLSEESRLAPISPYGLEKYVNEQYATLFESLYGFRSMGLRYFNVFGPRQDPKSPYAGVISKFIERISAKQPLLVFGDGLQTRDFIYVKDIAQANRAALEGTGTGACNIATGKTWTLLQVIETLSTCVKQSLKVEHKAPRDGDIMHSAAYNDRLREVLGYTPKSTLENGLRALLKSLE
ncbi:NAD-dependent epimerase/dehydratase family protein [Candidatus Nitronereus thalassa]|uniref:NAD-dependent epimerase/dehydratase family protein n=1 Tax=Candidatus Nitronereus thalassa TaxID=3020898 RepID=A0ABU3K4I0_9BACT|nr:NAD-dependent epimerase/dehydratase family protein [Candidatus Nitronereus thalassa]MDT7041297.1 NAD-dependent epimerase/dehydratase family protein [Candidatus Nitronereus thalassa]